jgi:hypothetical protein
MSKHRLEGLALAAAFAVAHTQSPLYYSNQNQYLLHGAAWGRHGHLAHDWLATTRDPTPLFSALVAAAYRVHEWLLQPAFFALLMGYFLAARWLVAALPGATGARATRVAFAALFTAAHAGIVRWASIQLTGGDYPWLLQAGLAAQYLIGPGIQPSAFGVLLLAGVAVLAHGRAYLAAALAALAVALHGTYGLHSALLTAGVMTALALRGEWRKAVLVGVVALAVVAPAAGYNVRAFAEPDRYVAAEAQRILAQVRIPHHSVPARWFDWLAALQLVWMAAGLALLRRTPAFVPLALATVACVALTALQLATGSDAMALLFPWRISVLLVPVATAVLAAKVAARVGERAALGALVVLVAGGVAVTACGLGYQMVDEHKIHAHVRATAKPESVYLLPAQFPSVGSGRGAVSNTFAPPPRAKPGTNQIPVDLQRFRLATGARVYVDFKSVPYAPREVLEWHRRMEAAVEFYKDTARDEARWREWLRAEGITHVVAPVTKPFAAGYLHEEHRDDGYIVYEVK